MLGRVFKTECQWTVITAYVLRKNFNCGLKSDVSVYIRTYDLLHLSPRISDTFGSIVKPENTGHPHQVV